VDDYQIRCKDFPNILDCEAKMMKNSRMLTIVLSLIFGVIAMSGAQADIDQMIQAGIVYIEDNQDEASGLWGLDKETPYRDSKVIVDVLARLEASYTGPTRFIVNGA
jgi:hypothetical protein